MTAHIMLDNAPFGPDDLQIAGQAFDSAWEAGRVSEKVSHGSGSVVLLRATAKGGQWLA